VISEQRARVQIEIDTRFLPRLLSILAGFAPCCHPINRISDRKSAAALSLIKNISTRLRTSANSKQPVVFLHQPAVRDLSPSAGDSFLLPANSVSAADRKSHPTQQSRYLAQTMESAAAWLVRGGTQ
jgi:hypothetical protein